MRQLMLLVFFVVVCPNVTSAQQCTPDPQINVGSRVSDISPDPLPVDGVAGVGTHGHRFRSLDDTVDSGEAIEFEPETVGFHFHSMVWAEDGDIRTTSASGSVLRPWDFVVACEGAGCVAGPEGHDPLGGAKYRLQSRNLFQWAFLVSGPDDVTFSLTETIEPLTGGLIPITLEVGDSSVTTTENGWSFGANGQTFQSPRELSVSIKVSADFSISVCLGGILSIYHTHAVERKKYPSSEL